MVYKTLHWYILRELLRIFLMTASALTSLLAFGGTFRPLTKQGLETTQLLMIIGYLMPAMLAYAIPIAALFAAVLVYWRLSTDNEMTACRASGVSYVTILVPALALGLLVASIDLVFVNYVVPVFIEKTERVIISDLGSLMVNQINQTQKFQFGQYIIYADSARQEPTDDPEKSVVILNGMAALSMSKGKAEAVAIVVCREARATITKSADGTEAQIVAQLTDAAGFDPTPTTFKKVSGSVQSLTPGGKPLTIPSQLKTKPKYLNVRELFSYNNDPTLFRPVRDVIDKMEDRHDRGVVAQRLYDQWKADAATGKPELFYIPSVNGGGKDQIRVFAPRAVISGEKGLTFEGGADARPVRVDVYRGGILEISYTCGAVDVQLAPDNYSASGSGMTGMLTLHESVTRKDLIRKIGPDPSGAVQLPDLMLPATLTDVPPVEPLKLLQEARASDEPSMRSLGTEATKEIKDLYHSIASELHSRGSFSLSCLTLVLLGAALGLLLRGKNPLAVFVVGFVPAIFMVLLITAGREMAENSDKSAHTGILLIWAGNFILLAIVAGVYTKLLRE